MPCQLIYTLNALTLLLAHDDPEYARVLARADQSVVDGVGCAWAFRRWTKKNAERVTGMDLIADLCAVCVLEQQSVFLLGARPGVARRAAEKLSGRFPGLKIAGVRDGFWTPAEEAGVLESIKASGAGLLLAALGQPRQEQFLNQYRERLTARVAVGVGGCLDVLAGDLRRAPLWIQHWGLEWLYRLAQEPGRIRRICRLPRFVLWVLFNKNA
jgi:N-acetylglucosaminyldiphosphoundecaprenol N-acetyl-beta-D-mannosaminyltransferase